MTIREQLEQREIEYLSPCAALSSKSRGRKTEEPQCDPVSYTHLRAHET